MSRKRILLAFATGAIIAGGTATRTAQAQMLRYDTHREQTVPEYANVRIGPFYSSLTFSQSVGYRYVRTSGPGAERLYDEDLGEIRKNGSDFPLVTTLQFRNYMIISPSVDVDLSFRVSYQYFPLRTSDNQFDFDLADEGLTATMGSFTFRYTENNWYGGYAGDSYNAYASDKGRGFAANFSTEIELTPFVKGTFYDSPSYRVDYVDSRGIDDFQSGRRYEVFQNILGFELDWLMAKDKNMGLSASRTDTVPQDETDFANQRSIFYRGDIRYEQQINPQVMAGLRSGVIYRDYTEAMRGNQLQTEYEGFTLMQMTKATDLSLALGYAQAKLTNPGPYEEEGSTGAEIGMFNLRTYLTKSLVHTLSAGRTMAGGYASGVEVGQMYRYGINWQGDILGLGLATTWKKVEPRLTTISGYSDWLTQGSASWALTRDLSLHLSSVYAVRNNDPVTTDTSSPNTGTTNLDPRQSDPTLTADYKTWIHSLGATYLATRESTVSVYVQRATRTSDAKENEFEQDRLGLTLTYEHAF